MLNKVSLLNDRVVARQFSTVRRCGNLARKSSAAIQRGKSEREFCVVKQCSNLAQHYIDENVLSSLF